MNCLAHVHCCHVVVICWAGETMIRMPLDEVEPPRLWPREKPFTSISRSFEDFNNPLVFIKRGSPSRERKAEIYRSADLVDCSTTLTHHHRRLPRIIRSGAERRVPAWPPPARALPWLGS